MNIEYISGFFDADGSITLVKNKKTNQFKSLKIDFCNNYLNILEEIQKYLIKQGIKSYLSKKLPKKSTHNINYTLTVQGNYALNLCKILKSKHPKKLHRINSINKYWLQITKRNGKYSINDINRKYAFERLFFHHF